MNLKGTQTEKNLELAFAGESKARNMYTYFASQAKKDGYVQISKIFEETSNNEKEHAKIWYKLLNGGEINDTLTNLNIAIPSENYEYTTMYPEFAKIAKEEGFDDIALLFNHVAQIEKMHRDRYEKLLENIKTKTVFKKENEIIWECGNCGFTYQGKEAMDKCPVCSHSKSYFFEKAKNY